METDERLTFTVLRQEMRQLKRDLIRIQIITMLALTLICAAIVKLL